MPAWSLGKIAEKTFDRVNTSVSITIASYVTDILNGYVSWDITVVTCSTAFSVLYLLKKMVEKKEIMIMQMGKPEQQDESGDPIRNLIDFVQSVSRPLIMLMSVIGIVTTTTIMKHLSDIGSSFSMGDPDKTSQFLPSSASSTSSVLINNSWKTPHSASIVLSLCFVLMAGSIPKSFRSTSEGSAM